METIGFLDPEQKKKERYNNHLKALINYKKQGLTNSDLLIVSSFIERKELNKRLRSDENAVFLLSVAGSIRTLFRCFAFKKVEKDLKDIGIELTIPRKHVGKINQEFKRRNKSPVVIKPKKSKQPVTVEYKRRRNVKHSSN